jgi:hypothetical protein
MPGTPTHEIVLRGRVGHDVLGPFADDFEVDDAEPGVTRLVGTVRDPSHLHGLVAYLASINASLISITPTVTAAITPITDPRSTS